MKSSPLRVLLLWLLAMLVGGLIAWNSRFSADMSFFLPAEPSAEQQVLIEQIKEGAVSRLLMLAMGGGDAEKRAAASRDLRQRLAAQDAFVSIQNGEASHLDQDRDLLLAHRYLLSPAVTPERFTVAGLHAAIGDSIDLLASPAGMLFKPFLTRDPTGELATMLAGLGSASQPASRDGVWASRDGERAMLLVQTRAHGADTDGQEVAIRIIRSAFAETRQALGADGLSLQLSGPGHFAVAARAQIKQEVLLLTSISSLAIIAVLFFIYRSPRLIGLGMLPVLSGALAGIVAVSLTYDTVFGITVGFGAALIGEAVDYSTYYFMQSGRLGLNGWRQRFWPTIRLGVATSLCGFGALLFSGFPGLAQLGLYSLAGVLTAALVTRFVLPHLAGPVAVTNTPRPLLKFMESGLDGLSRLRLPVLLLAVVAAGWLINQRDQLWHPDLSALSTVSEADAQIDGELRADLGAPDSRYLVVVNGADQEAALQAAERTGRHLDRLVDAGVIGGYDSPARFLPSRASQDQRRAALPESAVLRQRLTVALADLPLSAQRLDAFVADVEAARKAPPLSRENLAGSSLALAVDSLMLQRADGWSVLLPLHPRINGDELSIPADQVRAALAGSDGLFIDMKAEFDALYSDYLSEAIRLSLAGVGAVILLLAVSLRSPQRLTGVLLPLLIAVVFVVAGLHLLGQRLHLLHLVGLLLIVAVGSNYALFFDRSARQGKPDPETLSSMGVANLTTAIGFGTLSLSSVPVLKAIGLTVGPGAILALLLAAMFVPRGTNR
ncbi:MMPL family transporter [Azonexus hydrophilus]|uniref:MMPL family transporter n=1 Tax=Azonexus hydrophilus TaxID=418702 RepID=UPI0024914D7F|nr:MMPL family transporter [Azonexus hydrophilus]